MNDIFTDISLCPTASRKIVLAAMSAHEPTEITVTIEGKPVDIKITPLVRTSDGRLVPTVKE